jgi:hypothetical protein
MTVTPEKPTEDPGYCEFVDEKGLTPKWQKAQNYHRFLSKINSKISSTLDQIKVKIIRNCTTVVSSTYFDQLDDILKFTFKMWDEVNYPLREQLLVRTSFFKDPDGITLPCEEFPIASPIHLADRVRKGFLNKFEPDQIALHPRLSNKSLRQKMTVGRFESAPGEIRAELGFGGIVHIFELNKALNVVQASIDGKLIIEPIKGKIKNDYVERAMKAAKLFVPFASELFVPEDKRLEHVIFEFQIIPWEDSLYMIFNDYEIV